MSSTHTLSAKGIERLLAYDSETDACRIVGCEVFVLYRRRMPDSRLQNSFLEQKLGVRATARNWRTINTLADMAQALEA